MVHDREGFAAFCRGEQGRLVGALSLYLGDAAVAEELAQEALIRADRHWPRVRAMARPGAWLVTVGMNLARSHVRRRVAERRARARLGRGPEQACDQEAVVARVAVRASVAALPRREREVVILRYFLDLDVAATAQALGCSRDAVTSLTYRAIERLRTKSGLAIEEEGADVR
jgi:RNA polymerase sigma factor (sigma-70 family)